VTQTGRLLMFLAILGALAGGIWLGVWFFDAAT
jgi:hypothetical protein